MERTNRRPLAGIFCFGLATLTLVGVASAQAAGYDKAKERYDHFKDRDSLELRTRGFRTLASTADPRAVGVLRARYEKPSAPMDHEKYLIAGLCGDFCTTAENVDGMNAWADANANPQDAWLWFNTLRVNLKHKGEEKLVQLASAREAKPKDIEQKLFLRAAALSVLAENSTAEICIPLVTKLLKDLPKLPKADAPPKPGAVETPAVRAARRKDEPARLNWLVIVESCAYHLYKFGFDSGSEQFVAAAEALVTAIEGKDVSFRTVLVCGRYFSKIYNVDTVYENPAAWRQHIHGKKAEPESKTDSGGGGDFMGIPTNGKRIAYVIDMSDSMLTPLTKDEIEDLKKGPVTGREKKGKNNIGSFSEGLGSISFAEKDDKKKKDKKEKDDKDPKKPRPDDIGDPAKLPWDKIKNRFDAAREFLKMSLAGLTEDMYFTVIFFGNEVKNMDATNGMVPAVKSRIQAVIRELDSVQAGPKSDDPNRPRPYGTLLGETNLHGGVLQAYKAGFNGFCEQWEHVNQDNFFDGCDTTFILSDGVPNWDNWPKEDQREPEDHVGDPESGTPGTDVDRVVYHMTYADQVTITRDIRRLNMFRRVEINTIGIGTADTLLLKNISDVTLGKFRGIGSGK